MRQALLSTSSDRLIDLISCMRLCWELSESALSARAQAEELGWIEPGQSALTDIGMLAADPIRE